MGNNNLNEGRLFNRNHGQQKIEAQQCNLNKLWTRVSNSSSLLVH